MIIKDGFILRKVSDVYLVVATGEAAADFSGMITLNESGAYLWEKMTTSCADKTKEESVEFLSNALCEEYDVTDQVARADAEAFVNKIIDTGIAGV